MRNAPFNRILFPLLHPAPPRPAPPLALQVAREFVTSLGLDWNPYCTQIEPHDYIAGGWAQQCAPASEGGWVQPHTLPFLCGCAVQLK